MPAPAPQTSPRTGTVALLLFLSGAGSLALEVAWSRSLKLVFGSTTLAVATILVAYMLGLGLGGLVGGRLAARLRDGVRAYGWFELVVGAYALAVPFVLGAYPWLNRALLAGLPFWPAAIVRFVLALAVLLLPTVLMGATLPVLVSALVRGARELAPRAGLLYGVNTLGAVAGTLVTTFVFFPGFGLFGTSVAGAVLDLAAGGLALWLARARPLPVEPPGTSVSAAPGPRRFSVPLAAYGAVGFTSLVYEVAWTRTLAMAMGSSIHAFTAMLAAFLAGIALGSLWARRFLPRISAPLAAYGGGIVALAAAALVTGRLVARTPDLALGLYSALGAGSSGSFVFAGFVVAVLSMLLPTLVLGALFPLAAATLATDGRSAAATIGDVYFANTIGAAAGAFAAGFVLVPLLGLERTIETAIAIDLAAAAAVLLAQSEWTGRRRAVTAGAALAAAVLAFALPRWDTEALTRGAYYRPRNHVDLGIDIPPLPGLPTDETVFYRDGLNTTVSVHRGPGRLDARGNGKPETSLNDMPTQVLVAQVGALFGQPRGRALLVGLASGVTAGSLALHPFERVDVVEIEPAWVAASHFFDAYNNRPLDRPNLRLIVDDGRSFVETTRERYDLIVSEPSNPTITGVANLFTREFFHAAHRALAPGGRLCQWIQLYDMRTDAVRALFAAVTAEFRHVYAFRYAAGFADLILLAGDEPLGPGDLPRFDSLPTPVQDDLRRVMVFDTADLWSLMRVLPSDVRAIAAEAPAVNSDDTMFVELHGAAADPETAQRTDAMLARGTGTALDVAESAGARLDAGAIGRLALSFAVQRGDRVTARRLLDTAAARGRTAAGLAAESVLEDVPERAQAFLDEAVALDLGSFEARFLRARRAWESSGPRALAVALADVNAALAARPDDWRALHLRLVLRNAAGDFGPARADAERLLRTPLAPLFPELWADAAVAAAGVGRLADADREMLDYLGRRPHSPAQWRILAAWRERDGRADAAREALEAAGTAARNEILSAHRRARREARFGSRERAVQLLRALVAREPEYAPAREDLERITAQAP